MSVTRGGNQARPQYAYAYPGNGTQVPNPSGPVAPPSTFAAAGVPQPFVFVPPNWQ